MILLSTMYVLRTMIAQYILVHVYIIRNQTRDMGPLLGSHNICSYFHVNSTPGSSSHPYSQVNFCPISLTRITKYHISAFRFRPSCLTKASYSITSPASLPRVIPTFATPASAGRNEATRDRVSPVRHSTSSPHSLSRKPEPRCCALPTSVIIIWCHEPHRRTTSWQTQWWTH